MNSLLCYTYTHIPNNEKGKENKKNLSFRCFSAMGHSCHFAYKWCGVDVLHI